MPYDLGVLGSLSEKGKADLPSGGVGAELVQVVEGLSLKSLVGGWVPGDFNGICYLHGGGSTRGRRRGKHGNEGKYERGERGYKKGEEGVGWRGREIGGGVWAEQKKKKSEQR